MKKYTYFLFKIEKDSLAIPQMWLILSFLNLAQLLNPAEIFTGIDLILKSHQKQQISLSHWEQTPSNVLQTSCISKSDQVTVASCITAYHLCDDRTQSSPWDCEIEGLSLKIVCAKAFLAGREGYRWAPNRLQWLSCTAVTL